jgi:hypothetical protein
MKKTQAAGSSMWLRAEALSSFTLPWPTMIWAKNGRWLFANESDSPSPRDLFGLSPDWGNVELVTLTGDFSGFVCCLY